MTSIEDARIGTRVVLSVEARSKCPHELLPIPGYVKWVEGTGWVKIEVRRGDKVVARQHIGDHIYQELGIPTQPFAPTAPASPDVVADNNSDGGGDGAQEAGEEAANDGDDGAADDEEEENQEGSQRELL
ncbi:hypothetical protein PTSG_02072 [Salpingoeca rosetta]|uniref:Uncharacterized protein n=1 Tax=Salpingoeca rosetta (strain ATCC 50818 / BSB-021) TaxID=946362 RepID=F2U2J9_SALR5|nr:uncharacterized protein PTSG_02072 [Salpingoeca rosetta]EGD81354.1 hypothetical protein PTSG_02072 [Salpingoeca rosetta]|eukprot:XP_004996558.1 hypothetical protein PTSG_02072 [Salpingoeca rosetta]